MIDNMPNWLRWAYGEIGNKETPGPQSSKRILEYRNLAKIQLRGDDSSIPWCAIFINAALEVTGNHGSKSALAKSFMMDPNFIRLKKPHLGCIVVFSSNRGQWSGHVGFYTGETPKSIRVLSGNSDDSVRESSYPKSRFLGYFWPKTGKIPEGDGSVILKTPGKYSRDN